ncbi:hypothetical protein ACFY1P_08130 [Streptomyces sp. NPDC001407]|uniref:Gp37-like protein n=1 Tax=Streptomyces sp. NPDC001407 TaxID=3364573 RepID=UPI00368642BA
MTNYIIEVRDEDFRRIGQIDQYMDLDIVIRHCQPGSWKIEVMEGTRAAELLQRGRGVVIWNADIGKALISGPVQQMQYYWTNDQHTGPGSIYFSGKSDDQIVYSRVGWPDHTKTLARPWSEEKNSKNPMDKTSQVFNQQPAGDVIGFFSLRNFGGDSLPDRTAKGLEGFTQYPAGLGEKVDADVRFAELGKLYEDWCERGNVGYRIIYNPNTSKLEFELYETADKSDSVIFSPEMGNIKQYSWQMDAPSCTRAIVAAQGEGKNRYIMQKVNHEAEAEWNRMIVEKFIDRRDIPVSRKEDGSPNLVKEGESPPEGYPDLATALKKMEDAADEALKEGEPKASVNLEPIDVPGCTFGKHYWVGDKVTVYSITGRKVQHLVREVRITHNDSEDRVSPSIGDKTENGPLNIYNDVKNLRRQVEHLRTRY